MRARCPGIYIIARRRLRLRGSPFEECVDENRIYVDEILREFEGFIQGVAGISCGCASIFDCASSKWLGSIVVYGLWRNCADMVIQAHRKLRELTDKVLLGMWMNGADVVLPSNLKGPTLVPGIFWRYSSRSSINLWTGDFGVEEEDLGCW